MENLIALFCLLVQIPSPSLQEDAVAQKIIELLDNSSIKTRKDDYGNVIAKIEATDKSKEPLLISAHMDVVGDDSPVNIRYTKDKKFIETDKKRTLGADDKTGVACAIKLANDIVNDKNLKHGGLEIIFTRDEEKSMSGIKHVKMDEINSQYVLVLDSNLLGNFEISGAGYSNLKLSVNTLLGGHSGNDIGDAKRVNAVKLISQIMNEIPQGVYKKDQYGVITSINAGVVIGGDGVDYCVKNMVNNKIQNENYIDYINSNSANNIINTKAQAFYSIRSSDKKSEKQLVKEIQDIVKKYNDEYKDLAVITADYSIHLKPFEKANNDYLEIIAKKAAENVNLPIKIKSFHAGAETHIYAGKKNKHGQKIKPVLVGVANIYNMHSKNEMVEVDSLNKGYVFLKEFFIQYNK